MMRVLLAGLVVVMAACTSQPMTYRDLDDLGRRATREAISRPAPDTCQREAHRHLAGTDGAAIDQTSLPAGTRVICHNCSVTLDYRSERLNVELGPDGKVANLRCG